MPITPAPEAFGLHLNGDITKDMNDSLLMFSSLLAMGGGGGGGGGGGDGTSKMDEMVAGVVAECKKRLPPAFDIEKTKKKWPLRYDDSMNTVLAQEMERFNRMTEVLRESLVNIDLAIQGLQVMSAEMDAAYRSLAVNQVPQLWKGASYPSLKPLTGYLEDLYARLGMLQQWYEEGPPSVFWLSGFYFVQSFLTASLQNFARRDKIPIDEIGFDFQVRRGTEKNKRTEKKNIYMEIDR